jgi:hypothetical protein
LPQLFCSWFYRIPSVLKSFQDTAICIGLRPVNRIASVSMSMSRARLNKIGHVNPSPCHHRSLHISKKPQVLSHFLILVLVKTSPMRGVARRSIEVFFETAMWSEDGFW